MKVILLEDIKNLGKKLDVKNVSDGYVRNFLLPKKLVKIATKEAIKGLESQKAKLEQQEQELKSKTEKLAKDLNNQEFKFKVKIGKKEEVFGSIGKEDIKKALIDEKGIDAKVLLEKPLKTLGEYQVEINLGKGVKTKINIILHSQP